jgi:hypothetical protein
MLWVFWCINADIAKAVSIAQPMTRTHYLQQLDQRGPGASCDCYVDDLLIRASMRVDVALEGRPSDFV